MPKTFLKPNFHCKVSERDRPEKIFSRLIFATSEDSARKLLASKYLIVHSIRSYDFMRWEMHAEKEKQRLIEAYKSDKKNYQFKSRIWSMLRDILQDTFHSKCAYCDATFTHVAFGDVEHFRPKAGVTEDPSHPGYYWLAYDQNNLLPSCQLCNQGSGKKNHFPISNDTTRARKPGDPLHPEKPLLLNPYHDDFFDHLRFNTTKDILPGWVVSRSGRGDKSIEVYRLNRPDLVNARSKVQYSANIEYKQAYANYILNGVRNRLDEIIRECRENEREFCAAVLAEIIAVNREIIATNNQIDNDLQLH